MSLLDKFESPLLYRTQFMTGRISRSGDGPGAIHSPNFGCDETNLLNAQSLRLGAQQPPLPFHGKGFEFATCLWSALRQPRHNRPLIPEIIKSSYISRR
jgi:hypothetical protein